MDPDHVLARVSGGVGRITLNRPRAINALDLGMIREVHGALNGWRDDSEVGIVLLDGEGERGFCAGGDVRALHPLLRAGDFTGVETYFREEYALDAAIAEYPKPVVVFAEGVTMGGGIGLAGHAMLRIVTERSALAMPETRIGFTPDVGGTWLLGRAPGRLGEYLALTGATMTGADAIRAGFADHLVPSASLPDLFHALETRADPATPVELAMLFDETPDPGPLEAAQPWIDEAFSAGTVQGIIARLQDMADAAPPDAARGAAPGDASAPGSDDPATPTPASALAALRQRAPTALAVALAAVRRARELPDLRAALAGELGLVMWFARTQPDMAEGIRAQLVDKDRSPRWNPATLAELPSSAVAEALAHTPDPPLW